jgi:hypothetical protein
MIFEKKRNSLIYEHIHIFFSILLFCRDVSDVLTTDEVSYWLTTAIYKCQYSFLIT